MQAMPPFISKRFFGGPRVSRNDEREDTRQSPQQKADNVSVLKLSSHYAPNAIVNGKFTLYEVDVSVTGMRAVDDPADHEDEGESRKVPTTTETTKTLRLFRSKVERSGGDQLLRRSSWRMLFWDQMRT